MSKKQCSLLVGDGNGSELQLNMTALEFFRMVEESTIRGILASNAIEGGPDPAHMSEEELHQTIERLRCRDPKVIKQRLDTIVRNYHL